jgi:hypothetical protein
MTLEDVALTATVAVNYTEMEVRQIARKAKEKSEKPPVSFVDQVAISAVRYGKLSFHF